MNKIEFTSTKIARLHFQTLDSMNHGNEPLDGVAMASALSTSDMILKKLTTTRPGSRPKYLTIVHVSHASDTMP